MTEQQAATTTTATERTLTGTVVSTKMQKTIAEMQQKIRQSQHIIAAYERQTRRPLATDQRSLASVSWSSWNAQAAHARTR